ncbi:hypothetical protein MSBR3_0235 [Methanosarcina barkeri 3]|uniref:Uncharacterized protein n=1 Tax=Methanosarcina barkeri 3 TaxID=1434107 RepID=A0A0E3SK56_METBA|nr:hypothetical protein [Methanosarcina barkeri]AKB80813.1 hypothetical protein MSBR3_0235 [Methanosarcina barkeri 3]
MKIFMYMRRSKSEFSVLIIKTCKQKYSTVQIEEPLKFGIREGEVKTFLAEKGFSQIHNVTAEEYKQMYFHGINKNREVSSLLFFVHAVI